MIEKPDQTPVEELLRLDAYRVSSWLQKVMKQEGSLAEGFGWHALADGAARKARSNRAHSERLEWARIAVAVYDRLAASTTGASRDSFMLSSMMLRASMIGDLGTSESDSLLDPAVITAWFHHHQLSSPDEVTREAASWRELPSERLRELRATKNRLNVIKMLCESGQFTPDEALCRWLALRNILP